MCITKKTTIQDILDIINEPKETDLSILENTNFYKKYKTWDGGPNGLSSHYKTRLERIQKVDLKYPIIVGTKKGQCHQIIDGHHRILKAIQSKIPVIKISTVNLDIFTPIDARLVVYLLKVLVKPQFFKKPEHNIHKK
jgi:hypothetical protein